MIKSLSVLSISSIALLSATQAHSHVLCAPNNPQFVQAHTHNQPHKLPRIQVSNHNKQKHLQAQRARQQKALANQQRINQQRRAQALAKQQQDRARKAAAIQQQRLAAQRAQAARQKAALAAAKRVKVQQRQVASKPVYYQPAPVVQTVRYVAPQPVYRAPVQTRVYRPANSYVSVQINSGASRHHHHQRNHHVQRPIARYNASHTNYRSGYRYIPQVQKQVRSRVISNAHRHGVHYQSKNIHYGYKK